MIVLYVVPFTVFLVRIDYRLPGAAPPSERSELFPLPYHLRTSIISLLYEQTIDSPIHALNKSYCLIIGI